MSRLIGIGGYEQAAAGIGAGHGYEQAAAGIGHDHSYEQAAAGIGQWIDVTPQANFTAVRTAFAPAQTSFVAQSQQSATALYQCPTGYKKDATGKCVPVDATPFVPVTPAEPVPCPDGFERDPAGNCLQLPQEPVPCPEGFERDAAGNCVESDADGKRATWIVGGILAALVAAGGGYMLYRRWKKKKSGA